MTSLLIRIRARHYCAGLVTVDGVCTEAAPILRWAIGKRWSSLESYFHRKRFEIIVMADPAVKA